MFEEHELLILLLGIGLPCYAWFKKNDLVLIPSSGIIITAYLSYLASWTFSVLEGFFYPELLNVFEHISCMIGSLLLVLWAWDALGRKAAPP